MHPTIAMMRLRFEGNARISAELSRERSTETMLAERLSPKPSRKDQAREALFDLVETSPPTKAVMDRHRATRETLRRVYSEPEVAGAGQWVGAHFASGICVGLSCFPRIRSVQPVRQVGWRLPIASLGTFSLEPHFQTLKTIGCPAANHDAWCRDDSSVSQDPPSAANRGECCRRLEQSQ